MVAKPPFPVRNIHVAAAMQDLQSKTLWKVDMHTKWILLIIDYLLTKLKRKEFLLLKDFELLSLGQQLLLKTLWELQSVNSQGLFSLRNQLEKRAFTRCDAENM